MAIKNRSNKSGKTLKVKLTKEIREQADDYLSNYNCVLATALKKRFPRSFIQVLGFSCSIGKQSYGIKNPHDVSECYQPGAKFPVVINLIKHRA